MHESALIQLIFNDQEKVSLLKIYRKPSHLICDPSNLFLDEVMGWFIISSFR